MRRAPRSGFRSPQCRLISENRAFAGFLPTRSQSIQTPTASSFDLIGLVSLYSIYDVGRKAPRLRRANGICYRQPVTGERLRPDWHGFAAHQDSTPRWIAGSPGNAIETVNSHVRETRFHGRRKCNLPASLGKVIYGRSGTF